MKFLYLIGLSLRVDYKSLYLKHKRESRPFIFLEITFHSLLGVPHFQFSSH